MLDRRPNGAYNLLFLYPISTPAQAGGGNVIPTPSGNLPTYAAVLIGAPDVAELDAGTKMFELVPWTAPPELDGPGLLADAQKIYAKRKAEALAKYTERFHSRFGQRFNEA